jgi:methionyl-tRNA formyltransferase
VRVLIAGKGEIAVRTAALLAGLAEAGLTPARPEVVPDRGDDGTDSWLPSLRRRARARGWPVHGSVAECGLGPGDVLLSLQHDRILTIADLGGARAYNLHFAEVPRYRGVHTSIWPLRRGETAAAVTLHVLTEMVDAGPVVAFRRFELAPFASARDLYATCHRHGFELVKDHLRDLLDGTVRPTPQASTGATTYRRADLDLSDVELRDFTGTAEQVRDRCRSLIFPPFQLPRFEGERVVACYALAWHDPARVPGTVLSRQPDHVLVACGRGVVGLELG